jgi:hypothetical protein
VREAHAAGKELAHHHSKEAGILIGHAWRFKKHQGVHCCKGSIGHAYLCQTFCHPCNWESRNITALLFFKITFLYLREL